MNLLSCYVKSSQQDQLIELLSSYCGCPTVIRDAPVPGPPMEALADAAQLPSVYIVSACTKWTVIEVNSLAKLHELGKWISAKMNTYFLQTIYCAAVEYAYLLLYDSGVMVREIEAKGYKETPDCNLGELLPFEEREDAQYFDLDTIADYCQQWGVDISNLFEKETCTVVRNSSTHPMIRLDQEQQVNQVLYPVK